LGRYKRGVHFATLADHSSVILLRISTYLSNKDYLIMYTTTRRSAGDTLASDDFEDEPVSRRVGRPGASSRTRVRQPTRLTEPETEVVVSEPRTESVLAEPETETVR